MADLSGEQFGYNTGFKGKKNSQGTLFSVPTSMHTERSRQPRGYSPERYEAVGAVFAHGSSPGRKNHRGTGYGQHPHGGMSMNVYPGHADTMARSWAALARSTVPLEHIQRPDLSQPASQSNPDLHAGVWPNSDHGEMGHYSRPGSTAQKEQASIALTSSGPLPKRKRQGRGRALMRKAGADLKEGADNGTIIHEIGHHHDFMTGGLPYKTPTEQGRGEGFAEKYEAEHSRKPGRKDRGKIEGAGGTSPMSWSQDTFKNWDDRTAFNRRFNEERWGNPHGKLSGTQFKSALPKSHVKGQEPLLHKVSAEPWNAGNDEKYTWDYADEDIPSRMGW